MRTSEFLTEVRRAMGAPTYQARFSPTDVLEMASSQQTNFVVPQIRSLRKDFLVVSKDFTMATDDDTIAIPARAAGRAVRKLWITDQMTAPKMNDFWELKYLDLSDVVNLNSVGDTFGYYFEDDDIKLFPACAAANIVRLFYLYRPGNLVEQSRTCTVTNVGTDTLTVDATPSVIAVGSKVDVIKVEPGFKTIVEDLVLTARSANSVTVAGYDFSATTIAVGDIVSLARETSVIQLPEDAHEVLVWATANEMATSLGITEMISHTEKAMLSALNGMRQAMTPRSEDPQTIINSSSLLRSGTTRFGAMLR
jgi:hypothetical protein